MEWVSHKIDTFLAAVVIAIAAITASQGQVFVSEYVHRLGGQLDEARAQLTAVQTGLRYKLMSDKVRGEIETDARNRERNLETAYDAVAHGNIFVQPIVLARSGDPKLIQRTWRDFMPALPVTPENFAYVLVGVIVGFAAYEVVKLPFVLLLREPRRRRFRRRG